MTPAKVKEVTRYYRQKLMFRRASFPEQRHEIEHLMSILPQIDQFLDDGCTDEAMRWYGFLQGAMWMLGVFSIAEMTDHNRPDRPSPTMFRPTGRRG